MGQQWQGFLGLVALLCLQWSGCQSTLTLSSKCYFPQLQDDQTYDDSAFITEPSQYPELEVSNALAGLGPQGAPVRFFLNTTSSCFKESQGQFLTQTYAGSDYGYQCVCPTHRRLIVGVRQRQQTCWVVDPLSQDINYASCRGFCRLGYGRIDTLTEGYHCIPRGRTRRSFLVYCRPHHSLNAPLHPDPYSVDPSHRSAQAIGTFDILTLTLPTYCSCRGYFCT